MDVMDVLTQRQSTKATLLQAPAPSPEVLETILQSAMSAPDHGAIRPWRFQIIEGDARKCLSDVFEQALRVRQPDADDETIANIRSKPMRAPMILVISADIHENHPKVPEIEQILAAGAASQNILNACYAKGVGAVLVTGWVAFDEHVKKSLGLLKKDAIIGFIYLGTPPADARVKNRPDALTYTSHWTGTDELQLTMKAPR